MGSKQIMNETDMKNSLKRITSEILECNQNNLSALALIGVKTRGEYLAKRIAHLLKKWEKLDLPVGSVDITLYRDDFREVVELPVAQATEIMFPVRGKHIILIDDVLFTGRTVRAAIDVIIDFGRPKTIQLAVLVDIGNREFPICPNYVGKSIQVEKGSFVEVKLKEIDGEDKVILFTPEGK